jgi:hypothetical protein
LRCTIGLDIAVGEVRLMQVQNKGLSEVRIKKWGREHFSNEAIVDGRIKEPEQVIAALKRLTRRLGIKTSKVTIALPHACVISKRLKLPSCLSEAECEAEINEHLSQYLPDIRDELCFDFMALDKKEDWQELFLFATRRSQLEAYVNVAHKAGLSVGRVDIDVYALMRAVKWCLNINECLAVLPFHQGIQLILANNNEVVFSQVLLTNGLEAGLKLIQEIKSIFKMRSIVTEKITKIILVGESPLKLEELEESFSVSVIRFELFERLPAVSSAFLASFGLALQGCAHV